MASTSATIAPELGKLRAPARFANKVRRDVRDMKPRDMIDIQSFLWVQGSDEYEE